MATSLIWQLPLVLLGGTHTHTHYSRTQTLCPVHLHTHILMIINHCGTRTTNPAAGWQCTFFIESPGGGSKIGQVGGETFLDWTGYNYNWQFMQETGHYAAVNLLAGHENGSPGSISWCCVTASGAVTSSSGYPGSVRCSFIEYN